ncbi:MULTISPECIES: hypothetical protein [Natronorubrum]|uniref:DUF5658 domain-containing protein n=2 Tax=Natronorubrum bangense TaxID=61858 RepID=L9WMT1_9EURY|nr:hypothetical protein [Natronorubrum bangense]ELY50779.1 hypothetical protein C494_05390 [Natronorubrum bangense JCM 10635]QCC54333.1 hypothetical protein DV706_07420 [Natronorubrum bangense]
MAVATPLTRRLDPPASIELRVAFFILWSIDTVAATLFFLVPYATELNPVTVFFYGLFGLPGVVLAAVCYAGVVVVIGHVLSEPLDVRFVVSVVLLYVVFAANNIVLLLAREPPHELLGL